MLSPLDVWNERLRGTLASYEEALLRRVAQKLCKPRNHWPLEELLDRCLSAYDNAVALDRRLKELQPAQRLTLAFIAHSRQSSWPVGSLVEMLATLGEADGLGAVQSLLEAGLLFPRLLDDEAKPPAGKASAAKSRLRHFDAWLAHAVPPIVFAHPTVTDRILALTPGLPDGPEPVAIPHASPIEADGCEWLLRLAVVWQRVLEGPLRRTQQRGFFKRDFDRLQGDALLATPPSDSLAPLPDPALATVALALACGLLREAGGEITAGDFPAAWSEGLPAVVLQLWQALPRLEAWNPLEGWQSDAGPGNPYPSAYLLAILLLSRLPAGAWLRPEAVEQWIVERHPYWSHGHVGDGDGKHNGRKRGDKDRHGLTEFLLGVAYPLRLVQATKDKDGITHIRLSEMGSWCLGLTDKAPPLTHFAQTLLVQPNLEILAYRQGLTPDLIVRLSRCAAWKSLGAACTLQLGPETVYRALETGESLASIVQTLQQHGTKALPDTVLNSLRTWSNKRERISVYPSAALFEFPGPAELADALARGLPAVALTDRVALVANESAIDYRHFRLTGTRDYGLPPEQCIDVDADGVTLSVDLGRSDLLLETEIQGLAEPVSGAAPPGRRLYRLTPSSLQAARGAGWSIHSLENWFQQRTGLPLSPAARLLLTANEMPPVEVRRRLVLHVGSPALADGLEQWPATRRLLQGRLGPTALVVAEEHVKELAARCAELGVAFVQAAE